MGVAMRESAQIAQKEASQEWVRVQGMQRSSVMPQWAQCRAVEGRGCGHERQFIGSISGGMVKTWVCISQIFARNPRSARGMGEEEQEGSEGHGCCWKERGRGEESAGNEGAQRGK